jgi:hypothetical protein
MDDLGFGSLTLNLLMLFLLTLSRYSHFAVSSKARGHCKMVECWTDHCSAGMLLSRRIQRMDADFAAGHAHTRSGRNRKIVSTTQ